MALYYDLPVFKDVYQMTLRIFQVTTNFPREYKFTLGQYNLGLSLHVLKVSIPTFVMFARAVSFFNAALKTQEKFGLQSRSVPGSCCEF